LPPRNGSLGLSTARRTPRSVFFFSDFYLVKSFAASNVLTLGGAVMKSFFKYFKKSQKKYSTCSETDKERKVIASIPLPELASHVGNNVEVHYLDFDQPQIEIARIGSVPNDNAFYLTVDGVEMHITYWHIEHSDGRVSGVKMIKSGDRVLYENKQIPFDYDIARKKGFRKSDDGPARRMTREYLNGDFG
jgi:hypothetical protein